MVEEVSGLRALAHPLRLRILSLLTGTALSAAEVARELGVTHANASYHLRVLRAAGELVEAGEEKIRGGVAKRYRHPWEQARDATGPGSVTDQDRVAYAGALGDELRRRYSQRRAGTRSWLTDAETWVPPETWQEVSALVQRASELVHAEARPPRTPGTVRVSMTSALFEMEP